MPLSPGWLISGLFSARFLLFIYFFFPPPPRSGFGPWLKAGALEIPPLPPGGGKGLGDFFLGGGHKRNGFAPGSTQTLGDPRALFLVGTML